MEKHEFMSQGWIAMAREEIVSALAAEDLSGIDFTICEEFTNAPEHLRPDGSESVGFWIRIADGDVEVGDRPIEDADLRIVSDYNDALPTARDPDAPAADPRVIQERLVAGRLQVIGDPTGAPAVLGRLDIHRMLAPHTA